MKIERPSSDEPQLPKYSWYIYFDGGVKTIQQFIERLSDYKPDMRLWPEGSVTAKSVKLIKEVNYE